MAIIYGVKILLLFRFAGVIRLAILVALDLALSYRNVTVPSTFALLSLACLSLRTQEDGAWDLRNISRSIWIGLFILPVWDFLSRIVGHPFSRIVVAPLYWRWLLVSASLVDLASVIL